MSHQPLYLTNNHSGNVPFTLDTNNRKLCSTKGEIKLRPKLWKVLLVLLQNESQLIE